MIKMDDLQKILRLVILTGNLKNQKPVSLLVVSKSGNGKTELITHFKKKSIDFITDATYVGLIDMMKEQPKLKHIIIPDFIKITQKKRSTSDNFISLLNALTEEGIAKLRLFNQQHDFKGRTMGIITATTKQSFAQHKKIWETFGFVQRMLIVSFDYTEETIDLILEHINKEEYLDYKKENINEIAGKEIKSEQQLNSQLNKFADKKFRPVKILQNLAKANAYLNNRQNVNQSDIDEIKRLSKFMNLNYNKI